MTETPPGPTSRGRTLAVVLSFLWPGLGQLVIGRRRAGLLFAVPALLLVAWLATLALGGVEGLVADLVSPAGALALLVGVVATGAWRILAMAEAGLRGRSGRSTRAVPIVLAALSLVVVGSHAWAGYVAWSLWDASNQVFEGAVPTPTPSPAASFAAVPSPSDPYVATPFPTPTAHVSNRINILLTGIDSGPGRNHALNDTLMIVSVDPVSGQVAMISFPRDIAQFPLWDGRTYTGKINSLMSAAANQPSLYPDGPLPTLARELGYLVGLPIQYYAAVDLLGFERVIDAVGGVNVTVERSIADPTYDWGDGTPRGFYLTAGRHHLNGRFALAYARSRKGAGDNDFTRARRQQLLLIALRDRLTDPGLLPRIPGIIQAVGRAIRTNFPSGRVGEMLKLGTGIDRSKVTQVVLAPPDYSIHPPTDTTGGTYILRLDMAALRALSVRLFGEDSAWYTPPPASASPGLTAPSGAYPASTSP